MVLKKSSAWMKLTAYPALTAAKPRALSQEALADASRSHQQDVIMLGDGVQGEGGVDEPDGQG